MIPTPASVRLSARTTMLAICALLAVSCSDKDATAPIVPEQAPLAGASQLTCTVTVEGVTRMECRPSVGQMFARPGKSLVPAGANASLLAVLPPGIVLGGQGTNILLTSTGIVATATEVTGNVTVKNLIGQSLGTTDGTTLSPEGVRVFFSSGPTANTGTVTVSNADGTENFTASGQPYHQYNELLSPNETSPAKQWTFALAGGATTFTFGVYVWAQVQYPDGWVDVAPPAFSIASGNTQQLTATVRDNRGIEQVGATVNWLSSNEPVATVNATGLVSGVSAGTANITATSPNAPSPSRVGVAVATVGTVPTASADLYSVTRNATLLVVTASGLLSNDAGSPAPVVASFGGGSLGGTVVSNAAGATVTPLPQGSGSLNVAADGSFTFTPPTGFTGAYTFNYRASNAHGTSDALVTIDVIGAVDETYPETVIGNVSINSANVTAPFSVTANDAIAAGATITFAGWNVTPNVTENGGQIVMQTNGASRGQFTYNPRAGFTGTDHFIYTVNSGGATSTGTVTLTVTNMIWFVQEGATACTTVAAGCGRLSNPFSSLAAFAAVNSGAAPNPQDNQNVFLFGGTLTGPVTLRAGQRLIGQNANASLSAIASITVPSGSTALPAMGTATTINGTAVSTVTLASGNTLRGFTLGNAAASALTGSSFGTLTLGGDVAINNTTGQAMSLTTGAISGNFSSVTSTGGVNNIVLITVTGAPSFGGGALTNATGAALVINAGTVSPTYSGAISNAAAALVDVSNGHTGTLALTGQITTTTGTGLQFNNADGTYDLSGVAASSTLNGGDAGVDILNGSSGTFTFGANLSITHTAVGSSAFLVSGSTAAVTYSGNVSKSSSGLLVEIANESGGTITFQNGTLSATSGAGILANNVDGTLQFNATTSLNGGDAHIHVSGGSTGSITFGTNASVTNPSTTAALTVLNGGSATNVSYNGSIATNAARPVNIEGVSGGTVGVGGNITTTAGLGILIQTNTGGTFTFGGGTKALATGANAAVTLTNNTGATIDFSNGGLGITTSTGMGFRASGGGTLSVSGANNNISINGAPTALWLTSMTVGANDIEFNAITSTGISSRPVCLEALAGTASETVTLTTVSIAGTSGGAPGICLTSNSAPITIGSVTIDNTAAAGIQVTSNTGAIAVNGGTIGASNDPTGNVVDVEGGNANVTVAANLTKNTAGRIVEITSHTAGTVSITGSLNCLSPCTGINVLNNTGGTIEFTNATKILNTAASAAVTLDINTNAIINFSGNNLAIDVTSGAGFNATGGGTVNVTGTNNTVNSTAGGNAVRIENTTIGASGVTFQSVNQTGGANAIFLQSTGNTGGSFTVTGTGATGTGGTITNTAGADGATSGIGVYLNGTRNVDLSWMNFSGQQNHGVFATGHRGGLRMSRMRFTGTIGTSNSGFFDESVISLNNHGGGTKITGSRLDGAAYNALRVETLPGGGAPALDSLVIESDTVEFMQGSTMDVRSTALLVNLFEGTADIRFRSNRVTFWWGNAIHSVIQGTASGTTRITNNFADNTNGALAGAGGIGVAGGAHTFNISGNTIRHTNGAALSVDRVAFGAVMSGTVSGNIIGVLGDNNSGSTAGAGIFSSHHGPGTTTIRIQNNSIFQAQASSGIGAIWLLTGDAAGFGGSGTYNATVTGNLIDQHGTGSGVPINAHSGILATIGTQAGPPNDTDQVCMDIGGSTAALRNTIQNFNTGFSPNGHNRIRINQRFGTTSRWPGYTGAQLAVPSQTAIGTYLLGRNTASNSTNANTSTGGFNNTSPAGSACPQPAL